MLLHVLLASAFALFASAQLRNASIGTLGPNIAITTPKGTGTVTIDGVLDIKEMDMQLNTMIAIENGTKVGVEMYSAALFANVSDDVVLVLF
jgi:hypothetical protein